MTTRTTIATGSHSGSGDEGAAVSWTHSGDNECHHGYYYEKLWWYRIESHPTFATGYACGTQAGCEATSVAEFTEDISLYPGCFWLPGLSGLANGTSFNMCQNNVVDQADIKYVPTSGIGGSVARDSKAMTGTVPFCFANPSTQSTTAAPSDDDDVGIVPYLHVGAGLAIAFAIFVLIAITCGEEGYAGIGIVLDHSSTHTDSFGTTITAEHYVGYGRD